MHYLYYILIILSIILAILAGISDTQNRRINILGYSPTKQHLWQDSMYLLVFALVLKVVVNL